MTRKVTFCTLLEVKGRTRTYGIFQGELQRGDRAESERHIDLNRSVRVATECSTLRPWEFDYFEAARRYATGEYPPIAWCECNSNGRGTT